MELKVCKKGRIDRHCSLHDTYLPTYLPTYLFSTLFIYIYILGLFFLNLLNKSKKNWDFANQINNEKKFNGIKWNFSKGSKDFLEALFVLIKPLARGLTKYIRPCTSLARTIDYVLYLFLGTMFDILFNQRFMMHLLIALGAILWSVGGRKDLGGSFFQK
jgi:hypothetical protein